MKFILDANLPERLVKDLKDKYKIDSYRISGLLSDEEIFRIAKKEKRVLLTLDTDFLNILLYPPGKHMGIVVFRLANQSYKHVIAGIFNFFETFRDQFSLLKGSIVVIREDRFKIYPGKKPVI